MEWVEFALLWSRFFRRVCFTSIFLSSWISICFASFFDIAIVQFLSDSNWLIDTGSHQLLNSLIHGVINSPIRGVGDLSYYQCGESMTLCITDIESFLLKIQSLLIDMGSRQLPISLMQGVCNYLTHWYGE